MLEAMRNSDESPARARFAAIVALPDAHIDVTEAALWVAAEARPRLDVEAYRGKLVALAGRASRRLASARDTADRVARLTRFLHDDERLRGNQDDYYDPRNSFLSDVLDRGLGIPITLSIVWVDVARRLGLRAAGVGFPGHFLVQVAADDGSELLVDAFHGRVVDLHDLGALLARAAGPQARLDPGMLRPAAPREILVRLLRNLKHAHAQRDELAEAIACCDRLLLLEPDAPAELRDRGLLLRGQGAWSAAAADLERYLARVPDAEDGVEIRALVAALRKQIARLN
jgi:regulator of sirC expression with transglutaminase-like and TPR domain